MYITLDTQIKYSIWTQKDFQWDVASVLLYYFIATMWNIFVDTKKMHLYAKDFRSQFLTHFKMLTNISIKLWGAIEIEEKYGDLNEDATLYYFKTFWHAWEMCTIMIKVY